MRIRPESGFEDTRKGMLILPWKVSLILELQIYLIINAFVTLTKIYMGILLKNTTVEILLKHTSIWPYYTIKYQIYLRIKDGLDLKSFVDAKPLEVMLWI